MNESINRILISNMNEESKSLQKSIERLKEKISNEKVSEKVLNAIYTPKQSNWKGKFICTNVNVLLRNRYRL